MEKLIIATIEADHWSFVIRFTLPETNSSHLKMDGWNTSFPLGWPIFKGYISFRECIPMIDRSLKKHPFLNFWRHYPPGNDHISRSPYHFGTFWIMIFRRNPQVGDVIVPSIRDHSWLHMLLAWTLLLIHSGWSWWMDMPKSTGRTWRAGSWWFMKGVGDSWRELVIHEGSWWFMKEVGDSYFSSSLLDVTF